MRATAAMSGHEAVQSIAAEVEALLRSGKLHPMWESLCLGAQRIVQKEFRSKGGRSGGWADVGFITRVLRVKGKRRKYSTIDEVMASDHNPLQDTGQLRLSWIAAKVPNSIRLSDAWGETGTSLKYADLHQDGGSSKFEFGKEEQARFEKNFRKTLSGAPTGKRAKRNWNPEYFKARAMLQKASGKTFKVKARPMVPADFGRSGSDKALFKRIIKAELEKLLGGGK